MRSRQAPNTRRGRRSDTSTGDETISPGGVYHRLGPSLEASLRDLVERGLDEVAVPDAAGADVERSRDVTIADGTVRLHEFLTDEFQARHEERTIERIDVTCEKTHDSTSLNAGSWLPARRVLLDLEYVESRRFALGYPSM